VPGAATVLPPTSLLEIELKPNFVNLRNPLCFSIIFFLFLTFAFYIKCLFLTHTRRYILFRCLYAGTVVFTRLCGISQAVFSKQGQHCVLRSRFTRMSFVYLWTSGNKPTNTIIS
jgi:hypothetical protein